MSYHLPLNNLWPLLIGSWVYNGIVITSEIRGSEVLLVLIVDFLPLSILALLTFVLKGTE